MSTWLRRTEFSAPTCQQGCACRIPSDAPLGEIGKRLGRKALEKVACAAKPDTILAWYQRLIARKFDGSRSRPYPGRPRISAMLWIPVIAEPAEGSGSQEFSPHSSGPIRHSSSFLTVRGFSSGVPLHAVWS